MKIAFIVIASFVGVILSAFLSFCIYLGVFGLDSKVCYEKELKKKHIDAVREVCKFDADERIVMFYSSDLVMPTDDGNVLTNKHVYSYTRYAGKIIVSKAGFGDISKVSPVFGKSLLDDTTVTVTHGDADDELILNLAIEGKRDAEFVRILQDSVGKAHAMQAVHPDG